MSTTYISPEVFEQAKRTADVARREAMRELVDALWRGMTTPLSQAAAGRAETAKPHRAAS